ncbi:hypothetical protein [Frankia sp. Cr1]|uniref:DUF7662 domain-containing protein n=1 Tax=Frankia sp. Cr1 TaxID=3073931 RepID=UPI002AD2876A|nr:hypothetical protein [Frankia sp. Cr1]
MGRYDPLTAYLRAAADRGQATVELGFDQIEEIIGSSLPASSDQRQWWANSSHSQALAWRAAGFQVERVYLDRQRVRFARGTRGGSYADRGRIAPSPVPHSTAPPLLDRQPVGTAVDVRVRLRWLDAGTITLDPGGKPTFGGLDEAPGLYRMTLTAAADDIRPQVYIGETDSLRRRLSGNYRNPGAGQQTSLRINALLREHLAAGGRVDLALATTATLWLDGVERPLDLTRKAGRLLAENAALVLAQITDDADIVNLG